MVILRHELGIVWASGQREKRSITMVEYGDGKGTTAMARTVGLPAAIAAKMVMDGKSNFYIPLLWYMVCYFKNFSVIIFCKLSFIKLIYLKNHFIDTKMLI